MNGRKVILIGYMGAGKSSVGRVLAKKLNWRLLDMDEEIVRREGMAVTEIFRLHGEEAFRQMETRLLEDLLGEEEALVISAGGGLPVRQENHLLLKRLGTVVYLQVDKDTVVRRLQGDTSRPLLAGEELEQKVERMLKERGPFYREAADLTVDVSGRTVEEIAKEIEGQL